MQPEEFAALFDVPRGTVDRLRLYENLLRERQQQLNLVGPATVGNIWERHFADSAQLARLTPPGLSWVDIGAGAGFPGLVLAAMDWGEITLVESIAKKCRFLEEVAARLELGNVRVVCARIEQLSPLNVDVATARAAAPLATLLDWAIPHVRSGGQFVFPKGRTAADEVAAARKRFAFDLDLVQSLTDPDARIAVIRDPERRRI